MAKKHKIKLKIKLLQNRFIFKNLPFMFKVSILYMECLFIDVKTPLFVPLVIHFSVPFPMTLFSL